MRDNAIWQHTGSPCDEVAGGRIAFERIVGSFGHEPTMYFQRALDSIHLR
jgi:hypothetical protein